MCHQSPKHYIEIWHERPFSLHPLTSGSSLGHRLSSQTNTCLFCTLCPHSCAPGKYFPVGHPSRNCSGPSMLNFGVLLRPTFGKEVATCLYEYPINPIKPWAGVSHARPLKRSTSSSVNPKPGTSSLGHVSYVQCQWPMCDIRVSSANGLYATSVHPVPTAHPRCPRTDPPRARPRAGGICAPTRPCSCPRTYARTCP